MTAGFIVCWRGKTGGHRPPLQWESQGAAHRLRTRFTDLTCRSLESASCRQPRPDTQGPDSLPALQTRSQVDRVSSDRTGQQTATARRSCCLGQNLRFLLWTMAIRVTYRIDFMTLFPQMEKKQLVCQSGRSDRCCLQVPSNGNDPTTN